MEAAKVLLKVNSQKMTAVAVKLGATHLHGAKTTVVSGVKAGVVIPHL